MLSKNNIEISLRSGGQIAVQRILHGVVVDRYNTTDLRKPIKRDSKWIKETVALCSQPSANINIEVPPIPPLQPTREHKLMSIINRLFVETQEIEAAERAKQDQHKPGGTMLLIDDKQTGAFAEKMAELRKQNEHLNEGLRKLAERESAIGLEAQLDRITEAVERAEKKQQDKHCEGNCDKCQCKN